MEVAEHLPTFCRCGSDHSMEQTMDKFYEYRTRAQAN